jgi:GNAT superfamily N-acetyltransferase
MRVHRIEEFKINKKQHSEISELLKLCFSSYPSDRSFYKQFPSFRYLVLKEKKLIAHLAIIHRMIKVGEENFTIFGVSDLCVDPDFQQKKIARVLLEELETLGKKHKIDFITLVAHEQKFYKKNGFQVYNNNCRWLIINEIQSLGLAQRNLDHALMVKPLSEKKWEKGMVDFLGCLF